MSKNHFENTDHKRTKLKVLLNYLKGNFGIDKKIPIIPSNFKQDTIKKNNLEQEYITNPDIF